VEAELFFPYWPVTSPQTADKLKIRNPKHYPMIQIQMTKTVGSWVSVLDIGALAF
jgi:hypothetical protein